MAIIEAKSLLPKNRQKPSGDTVLDAKSDAGRVGMLMGALAGLYIAYKNKYNVLVAVAIGGIAGNVLTRVMVSRKSMNDKTKEE